MIDTGVAASTPTAAPPARRMWWRRLLPIAVVLLLAGLPYSALSLPGVLPGPVNSPGSLQLLALCLLFAGFAVTYDLLFGHTGLLSFGHALYIAAGSYTVNIAVTEFGLGLPAALGLVVAVGILLPLAVGAVALRVTGIAFAMVTLAFAEVGSIVVLADPGHVTGGDEGLALAPEALPDAFAGVANTANLYWLALAYLVLVVVVVRWAINSEPGRVWAAIRENERRVSVLGLRPYRYRLLAFVLASFLATLGGVVHLFLLGGSNPGITTATFTVALIVMTVLGGVGGRWGAILGGIVYTYLDHRLAGLASSDAVEGLPEVLRAPLSEPQFTLGILFILVILFLPGGLAGLGARFRAPRSRQE